MSMRMRIAPATWGLGKQNGINGTGTTERRVISAAETTRLLAERQLRPSGRRNEGHACRVSSALDSSVFAIQGRRGRENLHWSPDDCQL